MIRISTAMKQEISKQFDTSVLTVNSAVAFETKSSFARMIRAYALNHSGELYTIYTIKNRLEVNNVVLLSDYCIMRYL